MIPTCFEWNLWIYQWVALPMFFFSLQERLYIYIISILRAWYDGCAGNTNCQLHAAQRNVIEIEPRRENYAKTDPDSDEIRRLSEFWFEKLCSTLFSFLYSCNGICFSFGFKYPINVVSELVVFVTLVHARASYWDLFQIHLEHRH